MISHRATSREISPCMMVSHCRCNNSCHSGVCSMAPALRWMHWKAILDWTFYFNQILLAHCLSGHNPVSFKKFVPHNCKYMIVVVVIFLVLTYDSTVNTSNAFVTLYPGCSIAASGQSVPSTANNQLAFVTQLQQTADSNMSSCGGLEVSLVMLLADGKSFLANTEAAFDTNGSARISLDGAVCTKNSVSCWMGAGYWPYSFLETYISLQNDSLNAACNVSFSLLQQAPFILTANTVSPFVVTGSLSDTQSAIFMSSTDNVQNASLIVT